MARLQVQRSSLDILARAASTLALLVIAGCDDKTIEARLAGRSTAGATPTTGATPSASARPTAEGGGPLEVALIPPGKGWFCSQLEKYYGGGAPGLPVEQICFRTEAACIQKVERWGKDLRFPGYPTRCAPMVPWCQTGGFEVHKNHRLLCYKDKEDCLRELKDGDSQWTGSGCAAVP